MEQHIIICGLGRVGSRVLQYLRAAGESVVAIDNRCDAADPRVGNVLLVQGDCRRPDVLEKANLARARGVLILTSDDLVNISTALMVRHLNPDVRVVVRLFNQNLVARLGGALKNAFALSASALVAPLLALIARTGEALGTFRLDGGQRRQIAEVAVHEHSPLLGQKVGEAARSRNALVLVHLPAGEKPCFLQDVDHERRLSGRDRLVLCGEPRALRHVLVEGKEESLPDLLWAGSLRRMGRVGWRFFSEIDFAVKVTTITLLAVIAVSTLVFTLGMKDDSVAQALYRTISLMATGSDMGGRELEHAWQKIFVSALRILGAALTALFTAILTNYFVRAQLGGALEVRRIPDSGHIIVCGLGNVGFRVVEELLNEGERVVAVEKVRDNPFIGTARRQGVAVIVGSATLLEVLRQANAAGARAVVAATENELANLEIALLAQELNPGQRVVVRLNDPNLAQTLRAAANIRLALSIPDLAAPAFVAALYGDRVRSVFFVADRLLAVVDLMAGPHDSYLEGQAVRALAVDYRLVPLWLQRGVAGGSVGAADARLQVGDCLTVVIGLPDLQRLLQREKPPADHAVEVTAWPQDAHEQVLQLVRAGQGLGVEDAERALEQLPVCVKGGLTRGQAEDFVYRLGRQNITARVRRADDSSLVVDWA